MGYFKATALIALVAVFDSICTEPAKAAATVVVDTCVVL